jgi:hypothetical protein
MYIYTREYLHFPTHPNHTHSPTPTPCALSIRAVEEEISLGSRTKWQ